MNRRRAGLSLVESALAISIAGSLLAIFAPTFFRSLHMSKTSEATTSLEDMYLRTALYFGEAHREGPVVRRWCLPDEAGPTPRHPSADPVEFDFGDPHIDGHETWRAIGFQPRRIRYRYSLVPEAVGCGIRRPEHQPVVTFVAEGDLDQDGQLSTFERSASVSTGGELVPEGAVRTNAPVE